jgi:hypothetical protein
MKKCITCNKEKNLKEFFKDKSSKDGLKYKCKSCVKQYREIYNIENKEKIKTYNSKNNEIIKKQKKEYYVNNKTEHKLRGYGWKKENKEKVRLYEKKYKEKNKIWFQIKNSISCRLWSSLKNNFKKSHKTEKYLGCNIDEYKQYLESLFLPEFTWGNYGKIWEIDHIKPLSKFNLIKEEEQFSAFNYKNTQPLFKTTEIAEFFGYINYVGNREKGDK